MKRLYIWVEGNDDLRFFTRVVKPRLQDKYQDIRIRKYMKMKKKKVNYFLESIKGMRDDYIFVGDIDSSTCVTTKKGELKGVYEKVDTDKIVVVKREIESWYLAGLDDMNAKKVGIPPLMNTEDITKEHFNALVPHRFDSRIDFMMEILKLFSVETAKKKNGSFKYFIEKHVSPQLVR